MKTQYQDWAIKTFIDIAKTNSASGFELQMAKVIEQKIMAIGIPFGGPLFDEAYLGLEKHGLKSSGCGNMFIFIPASRGCEHLPCMGFNAHMDRVEPGQNITPSFNDDKTLIVSDGTTILGADDGAGLGTILTMLMVLHKEAIPHGPLQIIFTIAEEVKLLGSRYLDPKMLKAEMIFSFDGSSPAEVVLGACSSELFTIKVHGKNAHAGMHPDHGISAPMIMAEALSQIKSRGSWSRIERAGYHAGSVNINVIDHQTVATNSVQAELTLKGEARAFDQNLLRDLLSNIQASFHDARRQVTDNQGRTGTFEFSSERAYDSFQIAEHDEITQRAVAAIKKAGLEPDLRPNEMGGLDACYFNAHVPTIALGMGSHRYHTTEEYLNVSEYLAACEIAVTLASAN